QSGETSCNGFWTDNTRPGIQQGLFHRRDCNVASCVVDHDCATLGGITVCIELAAVRARLFRSALSAVQADDIISRAHRHTGFVAGGVNGLKDAGLLGIAIRAAEIIFAVSVDDAALSVIEKLRGLSAAVIMHVNFFRPVRRWGGGLCSGLALADSCFLGLAFGCG